MYRNLVDAVMSVQNKLVALSTEIFTCVSISPFRASVLSTDSEVALLTVWSRIMNSVVPTSTIPLATLDDDAEAALSARLPDKLR